MNSKQKEAIYKLREQGQSYAKIADTLGISENTIKSHCRRNNIIGAALAEHNRDGIMYCRQCGAPLNQAAGKKQKRYCSDRCRTAWWNAHPDAVSHKSIRLFICQTCGLEFESYGKRERKYCSSACYGKSKAVQA